MNSIYPRIVAILLLATSLPVRPKTSWNAGELQQALKKLTVMGSALYIAAHPDDENTAVLSYLANEAQVRTLICRWRAAMGAKTDRPEIGDLLGVIRLRNCWLPGVSMAHSSSFARGRFRLHQIPRRSVAVLGRRRDTVKCCLGDPQVSSRCDHHPFHTGNRRARTAPGLRVAGGKSLCRRRRSKPIPRTTGVGKTLATKAAAVGRVDARHFANESGHDRFRECKRR
ncbi:MAG: hypothetical protein R3C26_01870 [Calditrichia bacterium]